MKKHTLIFITLILLLISILYLKNKPMIQTLNPAIKVNPTQEKENKNKESISSTNFPSFLNECKNVFYKPQIKSYDLKTGERLWVCGFEFQFYIYFQSDPNNSKDHYSFKEEFGVGSAREGYEKFEVDRFSFQLLIKGFKISKLTPFYDKWLPSQSFEYVCKGEDCDLRKAYCQIQGINRKIDMKSFKKLDTLFKNNELYTLFDSHETIPLKLFYNVFYNALAGHKKSFSLLTMIHEDCDLKDEPDGELHHIVFWELEKLQKEGCFK